MISRLPRLRGPKLHTAISPRSVAVAIRPSDEPAYLKICDFTARNFAIYMHFPDNKMFLNGEKRNATKHGSFVAI